MKGDFSRIRFEPNKHFTDVLDQQGRLAFDADHNEQRFIDAHRRTLETIDVIGQYGAPEHDAGFEIGITSTGIGIGAGRYYVHGLLCENAAQLDYGEQPFLIETDDATDIRTQLAELRRTPDSCLCVYLEVWQRMLTALDDTCLREPALGQADTTVRMQTVWRVLARPFTPPKKSVSGDAIYRGGISRTGLLKDNLSRLDILREPVKIPGVTPTPTPPPASADVIEQTGCSCEAMYDARPVAHTGRLSARVAEGGDGCGCQPIPAAGYTGQENQLYRFEIQQSGTVETATLKWSRENGSIVVAVLSVSGNKVTVSSLGMDANLGFQEGQWVEISEDADLFGDVPDQPGRLYKIRWIEKASRVLTMTTTVQPIDCSRNARMRRWDQTGPAATATGVPLSADWISIENGIQVRFAQGEFFAGDAWTVPARSATGQIEWPPCASDRNPFQLPHYAHVYRAPLACIRFDPGQANDAAARATRDTSDGLARLFVVDECRRIFPPLTELGQGSANALLIESINWNNDDVMTLDVLVKQGLQVTLSQPTSCPLTAANFIVTLEVPLQIPGRQFMTNAATTNPATTDATTTNAPTLPAAALSAAEVAFKRPTLGPTILRTELIVDSLVSQSGNSLSWQLPYDDAGLNQLAELEYINQQLETWAQIGVPIRARVKLPGHALYTVTDAGARLYLDGQAFGQTATDGTTNTSRIDLGFVSGDARRASDFDSWFYLYPVLSAQSVSLAFSSVWIRETGDTAVIVTTEPVSEAKPPVQQATVTLNYAVPSDTAVQLAVSDPTVASAPSTVTVKRGQSRATVNLSVQNTPAATETVTVTVTASLASALDRASSQSATFTVHGSPPAPT